MRRSTAVVRSTMDSNDLIRSDLVVGSYLVRLEFSSQVSGKVGCLVSASQVGGTVGGQVCASQAAVTPGCLVCSSQAVVTAC